ncbi:MAG: hypothetical protein QOG20_5630 [Pseudonocardiales bacterium]|jgi:hypothetical protein|nr:hypothetical protein [Pseudonocardiales bacterium]
MRDVAQSSDNSPAPSTPAQRDEHPRRREGTCGGRDEAEAVTGGGGNRRPCRPPVYSRTYRRSVT